MKLLASLVASSALALSMLVAVPTTATAAPYPGTVATKSSLVVPGTVRKNRKLRVKIRVRANGNSRVAGLVRVRVYKLKTRKHHRPKYSLVRQRLVRYEGREYHKLTFHRTFKSRGRYAAKMWFGGYSDSSVYKNSHSRLKYFRVKR